ncbi:MAG: hypothetical protein WCT49_00715 [Candidatus Paceibacterota bacterium]|jgi:hypothetical protein|nr:hypothetical protein [Candidatus Paceibacterota bacterium]
MTEETKVEAVKSSEQPATPEKEAVSSAPPKTAPKTNQAKKKRAWPVLSILGLIFAFLIFGALMLVIHPEIEDAIMSKKLTEENFSAALVKQAPGLADEYPVSVVVKYKTALGVLESREPIVFEYGVAADGTKCVQYYYSTDVKNAPTKQACVAPKKVHEPGWTEKTWNTVASWEGWQQANDAWNKAEHQASDLWSKTANYAADLWSKVLDLVH